MHGIDLTYDYCLFNIIDYVSTNEPSFVCSLYSRLLNIE